MRTRNHRSFLPLGLLAAAAACLAPAAGAAAAEVWVHDPLVALADKPDEAGADDPKCAVRLVGARRGEYAGMVVVRLAAEGKGQEATAGDLKQKDGEGAIPASNVRIRYALPTGISRTERGLHLFDALAETPRAKGRLHPVWVSVTVPEDAAAGTYEGTLSVAGRKVPLAITVHDWALPEPKDYVTFVDFVQSPESVALRYGVPLWSDKHFELIGKSFDHLARVGNKSIYLFLTGKTNLGNSDTMIRWIKTGEKPLPDGFKPPEFKPKDGKPSVAATTDPVFEHDYSIAERYLDLCIERAGKPLVVIHFLYEGRLGGSQGASPKSYQGHLVTMIDPKTKKLSVYEGPTLNNSNPPFPDYPRQTEAFWKPVLDGMRERLKKRDLGDETFMIGMNPDLRPGQRTIDLLKRVAPYARWAEQGHGAPSNMRGMKVGYTTTVWNARFPPDPEAGDRYGSKRFHGWQTKKKGATIIAHFDRDIGLRESYATFLVKSRVISERNVAGKQRGFGRMSADFWPVLKDKRGNRTRSISFRYPESNWSQLNLRMQPFLAPGPEGAIPTVRFEMLREGVQAAEARIFIDRAIVDKAQNAKLGEDLAKKCQAVLDDRVRVINKVFGDRKKKIKGDINKFIEGWPERSDTLYATAAEVSKKLGAE